MDVLLDMWAHRELWAIQAALYLWEQIAPGPSWQPVMGGLLAALWLMCCLVCCMYDPPVRQPLDQAVPPLTLTQLCLPWENFMGISYALIRLMLYVWYQATFWPVTCAIVGIVLVVAWVACMLLGARCIEREVHRQHTLHRQPAGGA